MSVNLVCCGNVTCCINVDITPYAYLWLLTVIEVPMNAYVVLMNVIKCYPKKKHFDLKL